MTEYGDWFVWHEDPVQIVHGNSDDHHPTTPGYPDAGAFLTPNGHTRADYLYQRSFGGPFPSDDPTCGFRSATSRGRSDLSFGVDWPGFCTDPAGTFDGGGGENNQGSWWMIDNSGRGIFGDQQVNTLTDTYGYTLSPWLVPSTYNFYLDDPDVLADYDAAAAAAPAGWSVEVETPYPVLELLEYAPDEPTADIGNTGQVSWLIDSTGDGWSWRSDGWHGGDRPNGTSVADYSGGDAAWQEAPSGWIPSQDPGTGEFVPPEDEIAAAVYLTVAHENIINGDATAGGEGTVTSAGRFYQTLGFRATWRVPRMRYYREVTTVVRQWPRDDARGVSSAPRLWPPSKSRRLAGGYPGGSNA